MMHGPSSAHKKSYGVLVLAFLCAGLLSSCATSPEAPVAYVDQAKWAALTQPGKCLGYLID